jgi:hypothetical protein
MGADRTFQRRVAIPVVVALAALAASAPAQAATARFEVSVNGFGKYHSSYTTKTTRATADFSGSCIDTRTEDTQLAWTTLFHLTLQLGRKGVARATDAGAPVAHTAARSTVSDETAPGPEGDGCFEPSTGYSTAGSSNCSGDSVPAGQQVLTVTGAPAAGRTVLSVTGPRFEGSWTYYNGSCAQHQNGRPLVIPDGATFPHVLAATFPVSSRTWATLPRGRWFRVKVSPGHYAPADLFPLPCGDGCHRELSWNGVVRIKRVR